MKFKASARFWLGLIVYKSTSNKHSGDRLQRKTFLVWNNTVYLIEFELSFIFLECLFTKAHESWNSFLTRNLFMNFR